MAFNACMIVAVLAFAALAQAQSPNVTAPITFTSIMPPKLAVKIASYSVHNETVLASMPCLSQAPGSACLPVVHSARDKVKVVYNVLPEFKANLTDSVMLKACYSNFSSVDRPWRAYNNIIAKSKKCPYIIAQNLNPESGNATWKIPNTVPAGTYFIRAFVLKNSTKVGGLPQSQVAFGTSKGYFQVKPIDGITNDMKIAAGICSCVGPLLFIGYFVVTAILKKNK